MKKKNSDYLPPRNEITAYIHPERWTFDFDSWERGNRCYFSEDQWKSKEWKGKSTRNKASLHKYTQNCEMFTATEQVANYVIISLGENNSTTLRVTNLLDAETGQMSLKRGFWQPIGCQKEPNSPQRSSTQLRWT